MDAALEAGAEDVVEEENEFQILTAPEDFDDVRSALEESGVSFSGCLHFHDSPEYCGGCR